MTREETIRLIHAFLTDQLGEQGVAEFEMWRNASPENQQLYEEIKRAWEVATQYRTPEFSGDGAYVRFKSNMQREVSKRRWLTPALRIAATILLVAVTGWLVYSHLLSPDWQTVRADELSVIVLPDNTEVHLREGAELSYPVRFRGHNRSVKLTGEAYFDVTKDAVHPFVVDGGHADLTVLGTEFGVVADGIAGITTVYVREGLVRLQPHQAGRDLYLDVEAGQGASYDNHTSVLQRIHKPDMNALSWYTRELSFLNAPMPEVISALEEYYEVEIDYSKAGIASCQYTSPLPFTDVSLEEILGTFAIIFQVRVSSPVEGKYQLTGGACKH